MNCEYCGQPFSDKVLPYHQAWCADQQQENEKGGDDQPDTELFELRVRAVALGIANANRKGTETLKKEIAEHEKQ